MLLQLSQCRAHFTKEDWCTTSLSSVATTGSTLQWSVFFQTATFLCYDTWTLSLAQVLKLIEDVIFWLADRVIFRLKMLDES